ncbi:hypothetical protein SKAU_G00276040 [Synaphobranchus kaupii]|uniref:SRCR domain-containing protein n=1 Tax=Synaphobranchus kaupii TaxID=118154 RepID=A0A9Q1F192_SYNKA|nr:hypothetical protein SKAU_G00276040 [Synaphobranchus kaupii]
MWDWCVLCWSDANPNVLCVGYTDSRLVGGSNNCSGRVELQYLGTWGTVCDACWDRKASNVLCQHLNCGTAVAVPGQAWFGEGSGSIWADVFDCHGNETRLSQCAVSSWSRVTCSHEQDAGVICSGSALSALDGTVRLAGGSECEGQVEVYYQQTWRRVLVPWSSREASVTCRQLGCGSAVQVYSSSPSGTGDSGVCLMGFQCSGRESHLGNCTVPHNLTCGSREQVSIVCSRNGPVWLDEVGCVGNETSLWDCPKNPWGQTDCGHKEDVGVVCSEFKEMRLTEGCSGNLEVFYNGTWGNVCFNQMNFDTATLICQELNCGKRGSVEPTQSRLGSAPNWLDKIKCRQHDSTLWQCPSNPWGQNKCEQNDVAWLNCTVGTKQRVTPVPPSLPIPAVAFLVMGALYFLLLVVLGVVVFQNKALRRALSQWDHAPLQEAIYEEIEYKLAREGTYSAPRWGSGLYEDPPSGYDDVGDGEGHSLSGDLVMEDTPENYDDVITADQHPDSVAGDHVTDTEENYDDAVTLDWIQVGENILAPESPPAPSGMDYDDVGEEPLERGGAF